MSQVTDSCFLTESVPTREMGVRAYEEINREVDTRRMSEKDCQIAKQCVIFVFRRMDPFLDSPFGHRRGFGSSFPR
jgi:hypothetical protein